MAKKKKKVTTNSEPTGVDVAGALSKTEQFFENNKKTIIYIIGGIILVVALIAAYRSFIIKPKVREAQNQMFMAEASFRADSFELALHGDGNFLGFEQVQAKYGKRAGIALPLYAGICELRLGNNDNAIAYLKKYKGKDKLMAARAKACIGDALVNKGKIKEALPYFNEAAKRSDNLLSAEYLFKAALCYEELKQPEKAKSLYQEIKDKYPGSPQAYDIDKYISRLEY